MICVIATIEVAAGRRDELLALFRNLVPKVRAEDGCIEYAPLIDAPGGLAAQAPPNENSLVILEKWESLDALKAHLKTIHMAEYFEQAEQLRLSMELRILRPALE
ncbi:MAG: antibiotic biosynthesis monooxygenase [Pirellulaceae bacterium]|nr:antibiotic biosynthesis monooxygenase [Pirellulaceae bacterium]